MDDSQQVSTIQVSRQDLEERRWLLFVRGFQIALRELCVRDLVVTCDSRQIQKGTPQYDPEYITFQVAKVTPPKDDDTVPISRLLFTAVPRTEAPKGGGHE